MSSSTSARSRGQSSLVRPFAGLLPRPDAASAVVAPPYDVLTTGEARELARGNEWSILHVSKPEIDFPEGTDPYTPEVYSRAGENMRGMIDAGILRREPGAGYYVYRISQGSHVQTGFVAAGSVDAYRDNRIRRHEGTRPDKEDDRTRQIEAINAQTGPVLAVHRPAPEIARLLSRVADGEPYLEVSGPEDTRHSLWLIEDPAATEDLSAAVNGLDALYIGDGHHRSAAAARVAAQRSELGKDGAEGILIVCFPADEIRILGYHRLVRDLNGLTPEAFLALVGERFEVRESASPVESEAPGRFGMYLAGRWRHLVPKKHDFEAGGPVARLDIMTLTDRLLAPVLGVGDARTDPRIDFAGGPGVLAELARRVDNGEMAVAFTLYPTQLDQLLAVVDAGEVMPPKSTWFSPKLLDGLVSYPLI